MRKFSLFMLMAVGLLISASMSAMPERPVPPEPKAPEGVEMPKVEAPTPTDKVVMPAHKENAAPKFGAAENVASQFGADVNAENVVKAPRKAAMGVENTNVAKIGDTEYPTLAAAIDAYQEGVITLIADVTESVEITKDVQINVDTYTLSNAEGDDYVIKVSNNANVTIAGGYPSYLERVDGKSIIVSEGASLKVSGELAFINPEVEGNIVVEGGYFTLSDYENKIKDLVNLSTHKPVCVYYSDLTTSEPSVYIGPTNYETVAKATLDNDEYEFSLVSNATYFVKDKGTVTLLTEYWGTMTLDKNLTLDLNGNTLYYYYSWYVVYIKNKANVTIKNGDILTYHYQYLNNDGSWSGSSAYAVYVSEGNVSLDNVRISSYSALYSSAPAREKGPYYGVYIYNGSVAMTDSQIDAYYSGIQNYYGTSITLTNNDIYGKTNAGVYSYCGSLTYNSGKILTEGKYGLILYAYYGAINATIKDGVFENTNSAGWPLYVYKSQNVTATINGGYFKGAGIDVYNYYGTVTINGGTFYKSGESYIFENGGGTFALKGGRYEDRDGLGIARPEGYSFDKPVADGKYGKQVYPLISAKVETNGFGFQSVEEALNDEEFDGTITLLGNIENATISKDATLDLDIYSITGTLTVTDGKAVDIQGTEKGFVNDLVATKKDVVIFGGTYGFDPREKAIIAGGFEVLENTPTTGQYRVQQVDVASINGTLYPSLQAAIDAAGKGDKILLEKDFSILNGVTISSGKEVVIDLNGHVVTGQRNPRSGWQLVSNNGKLTLMDNTDTNKDGTGKGKLSTENFYSADLSFNPTYAVNVIRNAGTLIIESGLYETFGLGQASYAVDQYSGTTTINGGKLSTMGTSFAIRIFYPSSLNNKFDINGGIISSLWVQHGDAFTLHIQNATILANIGIEATGTNFDILLKNIVMGTDLTIKGDVQAAYNAKKFVVDSVRISGYNLQGNLGENAFQHLTNGQYQFEDAYMGNKNASSWKKDYPEDEEYYAVPIPSNPSVVQVYKRGQANLRAFMPYIMDGYGLVCIDEENKWYEIRPLADGKEYGDPDNEDSHTTKINPQGGNEDSNLANLWHRDETWNPQEGWGEDGHTDKYPQSTDPVIIDHNVIVEENSIAEAASIVIESGQKLIVQEGATLHIDDAGAIFKDATAQLVVEPNAVVTVGSNGIIADDENNVIVKSSETEQGVFMCDPEVHLNTKPKATVYLYTKAHQRKGAPKYEYIYQRFAIPTDDGEATVYGDDYTDQELFDGESSYVDAVFAWDKDKLDWQMLGRWKEMRPFEGYQVTNNTKEGGITYSFEGNLVGNHNSNFEFAYHPEGFQFFGNSYTAPIYIHTFLDSIEKHNGNEIEYVVYVYDEVEDNFKTVTREQAEYGFVKDSKGNPIKEIRSMQAFIMKGEKGSSTELSYEGAIWGNPRFENRLPGSAQAPRTTPALDMDVATIIVKAQNGQGDQVLLLQSNNFSDEFENGSDASKYIYSAGINLYANTNCGKLSNVATDNVNGTILAFKSGASSEYTIRFDNLNGEMFMLVDMVTGAKVEMKEGNEYTFTQAPNTDNEVRFMVMGEYKAPTGNENIKTNKITKVVENGQFYIVKDGIRYNTVGASFNK